MSINVLPYDISDFVKSGDEILICSDFEGVLPEAQFNNFKSIFDEDLDVTFQAKKIIYLGDMFDNTGCAGSPFLNENNYCALRTLKYLVDNPERSRYVVGNRDINKIKLVPLLQFKDGKQWWKMDKEEENKDSFISIVSNLIITNFGLDVSETPVSLLPTASPVSSESSEPKKDIWNVMTMEDYRPFWSKKPKQLQENWFVNPNDPEKTGLNIKPMKTLHDRFKRIFGLDTNDGTMSAANTLTGLPNELFGSKVTTVINTIRDKIMKNETVTLIDAQNKLLSENENEIRSAIVFTVFMRMLDKDLYKDKSQKPVSFLDNQIGYIDGYLYRYFELAPPALYAQKGDDLLLFSHGGITNEFVQIDNTNKGLELLNKITPETWRKVLDNRTNNVQKTKNIPMSDEVLKAKQQKEHDNDKNITGNIDSYNEEYFKILQKCFETFIQIPTSPPVINRDLMILLSISAEAENNPIIHESGYKTSNFSPIQPRLPDNSVLTSSYGKNIFNFCGHASSGNGYGLKKIRENMFFINTDLIATLFKKGAGTCEESIYNNNYLWLTIKFDKTNKKFDVHLEGINTLNTEKFIEEPKVKDVKVTVVNNSLQDILSNELIIADDIPYTLVLIDDNCKSIEELGSNVILKVKYKGQLNDKFFKNKYDGKQFVVFNGEVDYKGTKYDLYSYLKITDGKAKNILMLNKSEVVAAREYSFEEGHYGGYRKKASNKKSIKKNRKNKTKGKLMKKNSTRNNKLKSKKH